VVGDLGPGADADAVRLRDAAVARQRVGGRLGIGPHALLESAAQLGLVRGAHDVVALMLERRIQEESLVVELEVLVVLADAALAQGDELLALGERADGDRPFLESSRHNQTGDDDWGAVPRRATANGRPVPQGRRALWQRT